MTIMPQEKKGKVDQIKEKEELQIYEARNFLLNNPLEAA
jgi:hypothetical protein